MQYKNLYLEGRLVNLTVDNGLVSAIVPAEASYSESSAPESYDCRGRLWALPGMVNMHTHSAMTLLRSTGSGMPLQKWLHEAIFPKEALLRADDIYAGARDACLEMRETGTTAFNDMYFHIDSTIRAAVETGLTAQIAPSLTDGDFDNGSAYEQLQHLESLLPNLPPNIRLAVAPHAIYTVNESHLRYLADFASEHAIAFHMHLSETLKENDDCRKAHGVSPTRYLEQIGVLPKMQNRFIGAHALWLDDDDIQILGRYGASVVHNPNSNLKLGSGFQFRYCELRDAGVNVCLGTDGCASSDNLDLVEAMKVMALLQKGWRHDPTVLPADEVLQVATANGRRALGLDPAGIAVGHPADFFTVDLSQRAFQGLDTRQAPDSLRRDFLNRFVFAAHGDSVAFTVTPFNPSL